MIKCGATKKDSVTDGQTDSHTTEIRIPIWRFASLAPQNGKFTSTYYTVIEFWSGLIYRDKKAASGIS